MPRPTASERGLSPSRCAAAQVEPPQGARMMTPRRRPPRPEPPEETRMMRRRRRCPAAAAPEEVAQPRGCRRWLRAPPQYRSHVAR
eukprot:8441663-Pyramimonas_sp.AAC.1